MPAHPPLRLPVLARVLVARAAALTGAAVTAWAAIASRRRPGQSFRRVQDFLILVAICAASAARPAAS